jgi:hypothetical protein
VTPRLAVGPPARPADRLTARQHQQLVREELPRVRTAALAWRNGVAGLLAALLGFGLIRGRTDVSDLAPPSGAVVGVLLLLSLLAGTVSATLLLRAAHGRPASVSLGRADRGHNGRTLIALDHAETTAAVQALRLGLCLALVCGALLCIAVALTWYGPAKSTPAPELQVVTADSSRCGNVVRVVSGRLTLATDAGEMAVDLRDAIGLRPVPVCPAG